ncbi:MAG: hypothetical protein Q4A28_08625 [Brachymonas sp.]|nr:hypothetical protein [Brachymonas sp.]
MMCLDAVAMEKTQSKNMRNGCERWGHNQSNPPTQRLQTVAGIQQQAHRQTISRPNPAQADTGRPLPQQSRTLRGSRWGLLQLQTLQQPL